LTDWLKRSNKNIVAVLEPDSETLANIQKGFQSLLSNRASDDKKVNVICFFEEMPVIGFGDVGILNLHEASKANIPDCSQALCYYACLPKLWNPRKSHGMCYFLDIILETYIF
jgi:hypothetical protein